MKKTVRGEEFWREIVAGADASGLTRAKYAEKMGVGHAALTYWLTRLQGKSKKRHGKASRALVPVRVVESRVAPAHEIFLECGGSRLCFPEGTSVQYLAKLAAALRSC